MADSEHKRNIRYLLFLANDIWLLKRASERYVEHAPVGTTRAKALKYVEPFIAEVTALDKSIADTRRKLIGWGVDVPKEWLKLPIRLAHRRNPDSGALEVDPEIAAKWTAVIEDIEASIELMEHAPTQSDARPHTEVEPNRPKWDAATEARNKWLYDECMKCTPYQAVIIRLRKKPKTWVRLERANSIKRAANAYAKRNGLPSIPTRQSGRTKARAK